MTPALRSRSRTPVNRAALVLIALSISCEGRPPPQAPPVVRDSAGVRLIAPDPSTVLTAWKAGSLPDLDLVSPRIESGGGAAMGDAAPFAHIRDVLRLSDGKIVVAEDDGPRIRWLSPDGALRASSGAVLQDSGFTSVWPMGRLTGDSLMVSDNTTRLLAVFDAAGRLARVQRRPDRPSWTPRDVFPDGSLLVSETLRSAPAAATSARDTFVFSAYTTSGELSEITRRPATLRVQGRGGALAVPWTGDPVFDLDGADLLVTVGEDHVIERWSRAGRLLERSSDGRGPTPVTAELRSRYMERIVEAQPGPIARASQLRELQGIALPGATLAFDRLIVAEDGRTWTREYDPDREGSASWTVFDPDRGAIARLRAPADLEVMHITADLLIGVVTLASGPRVRAYRIERQNDRVGMIVGSETNRPEGDREARAACRTGSCPPPGQVMKKPTTRPSESKETRTFRIPFSK